MSETVIRQPIAPRHQLPQTDENLPFASSLLISLFTSHSSLFYPSWLPRMFLNPSSVIDRARKHKQQIAQAVQIGYR